MPYIEPKRRWDLDPVIDQLDEELRSLDDVGGDLNYVIARLVSKKIGRQPRVGYESMTSVFKDVTECIEECRRRLLAPYEDAKIQENGDVFQEVLSRFG